MLLERQGLVVETAADGFAALALARTTAYDVVVTDISMQHMDGIELGNALRADPATAESLIVVHSALSETWVRSLFAGFDLFLAKPAQSGGLATAVAELLHERQQHQEA